MLRQEAGIPVKDPMHLVYDQEGDEPLATDAHRLEQIPCYAALRARFAGPDCYVSFERWLRRDPEGQQPMLQPDLLVALGVPDRGRSIYDPWVEGKPPDLVAEWLSDSSLSADREAKPDAYRTLGIREYWLFNPERKFPDPRLQGFDLLAPGAPRRLPAEADGSVRSRVLPIRFVVREGLLEVLDDDSGQPLSERNALELRLRAETGARLRAEAERLREAELRRQAEAELQRLRAELERLRRERREPLT